MTRGRKPGAFAPGSLASQLRQAKVGDVVWTARDSREIATLTKRLGLITYVQRCIAIHPDTLTCDRVTRVQIIHVRPE